VARPKGPSRDPALPEGHHESTLGARTTIRHVSGVGSVPAAGTARAAGAATRAAGTARAEAVVADVGKVGAEALDARDRVGAAVGVDLAGEDAAGRTLTGLHAAAHRIADEGRLLGGVAGE